LGKLSGFDLVKALTKQSNDSKKAKNRGAHEARIAKRKREKGKTTKSNPLAKVTQYIHYSRTTCCIAI